MSRIDNIIRNTHGLFFLFVSIIPIVGIIVNDWRNFDPEQIHDFDDFCTLFTFISSVVYLLALLFFILSQVM